MCAHIRRCSLSSLPSPAGGIRQLRSALLTSSSSSLSHASERYGRLGATTAATDASSAASGRAEDVDAAVARLLLSSSDRFLLRPGTMDASSASTSASAKVKPRSCRPLTSSNSSSDMLRPRRRCRRLPGPGLLRSGGGAATSPSLPESMVWKRARLPLSGSLSGSIPRNAAAVASSLRVRRCRSPPAVGLEEAGRCACGVCVVPNSSRSTGACCAGTDGRGAAAGGGEASSTRRRNQQASYSAMICSAAAAAACCGCGRFIWEEVVKRGADGERARGVGFVGTLSWRLGIIVIHCSVLALSPAPRAYVRVGSVQARGRGGVKAIRGWERLVAGLGKNGRGRGRGRRNLLYLDSRRVLRSRSIGFRLAGSHGAQAYVQHLYGWGSMICWVQKMFYANHRTCKLQSGF